MPKYVRVPDSDVDSELRAGVHGIVHRALPELDLGAEPEIGWFADTRVLTAEQVRAARDVFIPGDSVPKAGNVPPFVSYAATRGWEPARPLILLNRDACPPDTALHELRHLWQIKAGQYRADEFATQALEDDADAWAAEAMVRLGIPPTWPPPKQGDPPGLRTGSGGGGVRGRGHRVAGPRSNVEEGVAHRYSRPVMRDPQMPSLWA